MTVRLNLPWPPTTNSIWTPRIFRRKAGGSYAGLTLSPKYLLWKQLAASVALLEMRGQEPIKGEYVMTIILHRQDKRHSDCSNRVKALEDACVAAGVVEDDKLAKRVIVEWSDDPPKMGAPCRIEIEALGG